MLTDSTRPFGTRCRLEDVPVAIACTACVTLGWWRATAIFHGSSVFFGLSTTNSGLHDHDPGIFGITATRQIFGFIQERRMSPGWQTSPFDTGSFLLAA